MQNDTDTTADLNAKLVEHFPGKIVRKDLTKRLKEGANVPVYVLEYLLGMYCSSSDEEQIAEGMERVKLVLSQNYVRPDEAEKVKARIRESGNFKIIDKVTVRLNDKKDQFEATLSNLGINNACIDSRQVQDYEKLLVGGIWSIISIKYQYEDGQGSSPFLIKELKPIQMPNMDMDALMQARKQFTEDEWLDVLLRSTGMEPSHFDTRVKWHLLARLIPFVENNYNVCELGPRGTGKSHVYKECSPNSILVSGGQTTVANLFYNMTRRQVGLVGLWDVVAFDEGAGISFKDKDGVQIMKDYMASGSFARGRDSIAASASMVFVGNINHSVETLVKTSHLLSPFPEAMIDSAFFDRFHAYIPGWEIPKMRPEFFTNQYGLIVDYLAEFMREMRKHTSSDAIDKFYKLGNNLNQRDSIAVRRTVSGLLKLLYPASDYDKAAVERCLKYALEVRRRVKEQLKKIGGMEFFDVHFSYVDIETMEEHYVSVKEQGGGGLIPEGQAKAGAVYTVATGSNGHLGLYRLETQATAGNGKLNTSGLGSNTSAKEGLKVAHDYFKANVNRVSTMTKAGDFDLHLHMVELHNTGPSKQMTLASFIAYCSATMKRPMQNQMIVIGDMSLGGNIIPAENMAEALQVGMDAGAKKVLLPMANAQDIPTVPAELFSKYQVSFYSDPVDAVFKALGVE